MAETCSVPRSVENFSPSQWTNIQAEQHAYRCACTHTSSSACDKRTQWGSPMASVQTVKLCELRSPLFSLWDNNLSVLSPFCLSPIIPFSLPPPPCILSSFPHLFSRMTICDLYTMPRVAEPVWLTMMSGASEKNQLCGLFMRELSSLMEQASKNQFSVLSTFLKTLFKNVAWMSSFRGKGLKLDTLVLEHQFFNIKTVFLVLRSYNKPFWLTVATWPRLSEEEACTCLKMFHFLNFLDLYWSNKLVNREAHVDSRSQSLHKTPPLWLFQPPFIASKEAEWEDPCQPLTAYCCCYKTTATCA